MVVEDPQFAELEMVQLLRNASNNLKETILHLNEVVAINTSIEKNLIRINLHAVIQSIFQSIFQSIQLLAQSNGVELINQVPEETEILGFPAYVDSVVLNFITNAIKYRSPDRPSFVKLSLSEAEGFRVLEIEDNGLGIDLKVHGTKLFGMYKTFHNNSDSRGIGLFITKNQIEAMGGRVDVTSEVNQGTLFKIFFTYEEN